MAGRNLFAKTKGRNLFADDLQDSGPAFPADPAQAMPDRRQPLSEDAQDVIRMFMQFGAPLMTEQRQPGSDSEGLGIIAENIQSGFKEGLQTLGRGVGVLDPQTEEEAAAARTLSETSPLSNVSEIVGEAAIPAVIGGGAGGLISRLGGGRLAQTLTAGGIGAGEGAAIAKGSGGDEDDILTGALLGGAIPALAPLVGEAGSRLIKKLFPQDMADDAIIKALADEGMTPQQAAERMQEMGDDALLLDVGDRGAITSLGEAAATASPNFRGKATEILNNRATGAGKRVVNAINKATGTEDTFYKNFNELSERQKALAGRAYEQARATGSTMTPEIKKIMNRDENFQKMLDDYSVIARRSGDPVPTVTVTNTDGTKEIVDAVDFDTFDFIKRSMDAKIEPFRDPVTKMLPTNDPELRSFVKLRKDFINAVDKANPDYKNARLAYAGPARQKDAMLAGRNLLRSRLDPEQISDSFGKMSVDEKASFMDGISQSVEDMVDNNMNATNVVNQLIKKPKYQKMFSAIFDNKKELKEFNNFLRSEARFAQTKNRLLGGSPTAKRTADVEKLFGAPDLAAAAVDIATGAPTTSFMRMINSFSKKFGNMSESEADALSTLLISDPAKARQNLSEIMKRGVGSTGRNINAIASPFAVAGAVEQTEGE